jgi:transcription termination factor Rho
MTKQTKPDLLDDQEPKKKAAPKKTAARKPAAAPKRTSRKKSATAESPEPELADEVTAVDTPAPEPAAVAPVAPAAPPPAGEDGPRARPLYIPREVEAFLKAANIPIPTDKAQLDAIMAAMAGAKMAAQQATASGAAATQTDSPAPASPPERARHQGAQHQQNRGQRQPPQQEQEKAPPAPRPEPEPEEIVAAEGFCEISGKGFGFLRDPKRFFQPHPTDVFVTPEAVKRYGLRDGQWLKVEARKSHRGLQIHRIISINDQDPEKAKSWPAFDDLTTISPTERLTLETVPDRFTTRIIDLMTPVGKGQRGLIVAPPRTGKTTLLHHIAEAIVKNHPEVKLMILLVDERPEEVTDFKRNIPEAELWASSNDMDVKSHTRIAQLCIERAKRLVECGRDVFILLDSITRLGRAFNNAIGGGGRTMSGGVDSRALEIPRKIFAAARNTEEAGSLTIVATALIETGSRMDELIFQEFKGTGNMEIVLDRKISDQRVYPAIDMFQSGTRRDELLVPEEALHKISVIRRGLSGHKPFEAIERLLSFVKKFPTNAQLLREIPG